MLFRSLIDLVEREGGSVIGIGCLWQRNSKVEVGRPVFSLVKRDFPTYDPQSCPLCRDGMPLNREFASRSL